VGSSDTGRLEALLECIPEPVLVLDHAGRPRFLNPPAERLMGAGLETHARSSVLLARCAPVMREGKPVDFEERLPDGSSYAVRARPFEGGMLVSFRELTTHAAELARLNAALTRSKEELDQFAYVASHDLQEPLRTVSSFTQLLEQRYRGKLDEKADRYIQFVVDGANRMQGLLQDLLTFSRVGTRGKPFAPTDAGAALRRALAPLEASIARTHAAVTAEPLPIVMADPIQLEQLFHHLLDNALEYRSPETAPCIQVSARREKDQWLFSVQDNGIGIESRYFERIFVIFQRLHAKGRHPGTGAGLALCKKIVERHGGRLWLESTPGQGSTFFFTLSPCAG
jgi:light-regulated signal transduction histidine kinase (bacteriophytochrome)